MRCRLIASLFAAISIALTLSSCTFRVAALRHPPLVHVVCIWLKDAGNNQKRDQVILVGRELEKIPGLLRLRAGKCIKSDRAIVDSSYDVAYVMEFRDSAGLQKYLASASHQKAVNEVLKPLARKIVVYDFQTE